MTPMATLYFFYMIGFTFIASFAILKMALIIEHVYFNPPAPKPRRPHHPLPAHPERPANDRFVPSAVRQNL